MPMTTTYQSALPGCNLQRCEIASCQGDILLPHRGTQALHTLELLGACPAGPQELRRPSAQQGWV